MDKIFLKTPKEIAIMAEGGKKLAGILTEVLQSVRPGISTLEIDSLIDQGIAKARAIPSFKTVPRYHWASCVGLNSEVVHSIPKKDKLVKVGDLVKVDTGLVWEGFHTDASWTVRIQRTEDGRQKAEDRKQKDLFLETGKVALREAIAVAKPGRRIGDISQKIQEIVRQAGFTPVEVLTGHGIGRRLHEEPMIPCFLKENLKNTTELLPGMVLAIEVIYNQGSPDLVMEEDNWTISTKDGKMSGLFEETIAITENEPLILTEVREVEPKG